MSAAPTGVVLLGRDHVRYGTAQSAEASSRVAASISVGADPNSPSLQFKGSEVPNEDAVVAFEAGPVVLLAVADAHFGHEASHQLISGISHQLKQELPTTLKQIYEVLALIGAATSSETESESTLLIVAVDRAQGRGVGLSYGDSTAALVGPESGFRQLNYHNSQFVRADSFLTPTPGESFQFDVAPGDTLLVFTDGLDECHYRNPATSVRPEHIEQFVNHFRDNPRLLVKKLAACALTGVHGNPGGQDNVVIAAAATAWP